MIEITTIESPVGPLTLAARNGRICVVSFAAANSVDRAEDRVRSALARWYPLEELVEASDPGGVVTTLRSYFAGNVAAIDSMDVALNGTPFQQRVWRALRDVPCGTTCSYGELAQRIGAPSAVRAVGAANGANPVAIIVPCHRVIGANGTLTGYGGGLDRKRWLLQHEAAQRALFATT